MAWFGEKAIVFWATFTNTRFSPSRSIRDKVAGDSQGHFVYKRREPFGFALSTREVRFFLASIPANAKNFARAVRGHWAIENSLHWSLDVCFAEDASRIRLGYAAENMAILRHIILNVLKNDTSKKRSIKGKQKNASWDHSYLLSLLGF